MKNHTIGRGEKFATWMGIAGNVVLFAAKIVVGFGFNSIAIISDSFNSLTDIVASTIVLISVRSSYRAPDAGHPFGHARAQPIAGMVVAILTGIVGFEIIAQSVGRLFSGEEMRPGALPLILLAGVMVIKLGMYVVARSIARRANSTALRASAADHRNDVLVSAAVIIGASLIGGPVSTTQVVSSSIIGVGTAERANKVRWGVAQEIVTAWVLTVPASALVAAGVYWILMRFIH